MTHIRLPVHRSDRSERGASLILAMAMVTLISTALLAALGFSSASLRTVSVIQSQRSTAYAADGAMQTAVQATRTNTACPAVNTAAVGVQPAVSVACSTVQAATTTTPPYALWSVGNNASETGIKFAGTTAIQMNAPVASNSTIALTGTGGSLTSSYNVSARSTCTGTITVSSPGVKACSTASSYADPAYASETPPSLSNPNPDPTCTANDAILQFSPGYYSDVADFSGTSIYTQGGHTCKSQFQYFQPGVYYFDFGFDNTDGNVWNVTNNVIGGQPKGFDPTVPGSVPNQPNPGDATSVNCKTAADGATDGVQFIFGGASQMVANTNGAIVELCPDPTPVNSTQQMTIYGQRTGTSTVTNSTQFATAAVQTPTGWTNPGNTIRISPAVGSIDAKYGANPVASGATESLALNGYIAPVPLIPAGAANISAVIKIAHSESVASAATNVSSLTAYVGGTGSGCSFPATPHTTTAATVTLVTDTITIPQSAACIAALSSNFSITYTTVAAAGKTFTENLDGIDVVATWTPPAVEAENGCTIVINSCSVLTVGGSQAKFVSWGTVYAPLSSVTANVTDTADVVSFRRGVVARAISMPNLVAPNTPNYFCLASGSPCTGSTGVAGARIDLLTATVSGNVELRALISYVDTPTPGTSLQILAWNPQR